MPEGAEEGINEIVRLIVRESHKVRNNDPVSRIYHVSMRVDAELMRLARKIRKRER